MNDRDNTIECLKYLRDRAVISGSTITEQSDWIVRLCDEVLELLKEQEPRVLTLEEATGDDECWLETKAGAYGYADVYMCSGHQCVEAWRCLNKKAEYLPFSTYLKLWRCWSARPTEEQREAVPWTE